MLDRQAGYVDSSRTRSAGYPDREYYRFDYDLTRTANWAESRLKRACYAVLQPLTRGRVDYLLLPAILEWPEVLLAVALCGATILLLAARALRPLQISAACTDLTLRRGWHRQRVPILPAAHPAHPVSPHAQSRAGSGAGKGIPYRGSELTSASPAPV